MSEAGMPEAPGGAIRYRLRVPALGLADYAAMQRLLAAQVLQAVRWPWRRRAIATIACIAIGGVLGVAAAAWRLDAALWISCDMLPEPGWSLPGEGVFGLAIALMVLPIFVQVVLLRARGLRLMRDFHRAGGDLLGAHDLLLADAGVEWRNAGRRSFVPWTSIHGVLATPGMIFLWADGPSAFWLPESLCAALPDREGFLAFLHDRIRGPV